MANNRRNIKYKLILSIIMICMSVSPVFASHVEIDPNSVGSQTEYFHAYNSNTNIANSYIDSGQALFSKAMNYMFMNIAKSTSSVYAIKGVADNMYSILSNSDTTLTNIATDIGVIKQANASQTSLLSSISSNSNYLVSYTGQIATTLGGSTSGNIVDIKNALTNINWDYSVTGTVLDSSLNPITQSRVINQTDYVYFKYEFNNYPALSILKIDLPIAVNSRVGNNWQFEFYEVNTSNILIRISDPKYLYTYNTATKSLELYITNYFWNFTNILVRVIPSNASYVYYTSYENKLYGLNSSNEDFYKVSEYLFSNLQYKELESISNQGITADFDDSGIIDAINNLSLQDNDVKLNLTINNNTGSDGTDIITRLQNFFDTGVSVGDFFDNVDDAESGWFTQSNSDVINTLRGGYTNFYE